MSQRRHPSTTSAQQGDEDDVVADMQPPRLEHNLFSASTRHRTFITTPFASPAAQNVCLQIWV
jgi:hypothetical protein